MKRFPFVLLLLCAALTAYSKPKAKEVPSWVGEMASRPTPVYPGRVPAVVTFNECRVNVDPSGMVETHSRRATKILSHDGKREAEVVEWYEKGGSQVVALNAWLVEPDGSIRSFDNSSVEDLGAFSDELYNDYRLRRIRVQNPQIGSVFVSESVVREKASIGQELFHFHENLPALESRYSITVPAGWSVSGTLLNHDPVQPIVDGSTSTWVLKNLPFREPEQYGPELRSIAPSLGVDFRPPAGTPAPSAFQSWSDLAHWHAQLAAPQAEVSAEIERKVRDLTAGLNSRYDKIRVIAGFVQKIRYVEIATDLTHNGGYRPHPAADVLAKQYGDCKDKANLMRTMLQAAGIPSDLVTIYYGDRTLVKKEWASPFQFNHMIIAIQVDDSVSAPTVVDSSHGRLILFDPTDPITPLGDLPAPEQGSYALLCSASGGDLIRVPQGKPERSELVQTVDAELSADGTLKAAVESEWSGQKARAQRSVFRSGSPDQYKSFLERQLSYYAKGVAIAALTTSDAFEAGRFSAKLTFTAQRYGQLMQGRMLVFSPDLIAPAAPQLNAANERSGSIILNAGVYRKHVTVKLPPGFAIDELPEPFSAQSSYGTFHVTYRKESGQLTMDEELRIDATTVPAADYASVKKFFDNVWGADAQNAVLIKQQDAALGN